MKRILFEYYPHTDRQRRHIWNQGLFVFDANVLLNLYRYSPDTRNALFNLLQHLNERIWVPYQAALEFHQQRTSEASSQQQKYDDLLGKLQQIHEQLKQAKSHPFASESVANALDNARQQLEADFNGRRSEVDVNNWKDPILEKITQIFDGCVGSSYSNEESAKIAEEGQHRYAEKIPPGFEDSEKGGWEQYGDLFIWYAIVEKANNEQRPIIFVTDDAKRDWWRKQNENRISPQPYLRAELYQKANQLLEMYNTFEFMDEARQRLSIKVDKKAVEEVQATEAQREREAALFADKITSRIEALYEELQSLKSREQEEQQRAQAASDRLNVLWTEHERMLESHHTTGTMDDIRREIDNAREEVEYSRQRLKHVQEERKSVENELNNLLSRRRNIHHWNHLSDTPSNYPPPPPPYRDRGRKGHPRPKRTP